MKALKIIRSIVLVILMLAVIAALALFLYLRRDIKTLRSLKNEGNGAYTMDYASDYKLDKFLKTGAENDEELYSFIQKELMHGFAPDEDTPDAACTAFVARNDKGNVIFGRNFDFDASPFMQVYTHPKGGYASVSTVPLLAVGFDKRHSPADGLSKENIPLLAVPYFACDGMNEKGVSAALLVVPVVSTVYDENKVSMNQTVAIRLILDKASTVDEAVELLGQYNVYFSNNLKSHILIGDAEGNSVIAEYYDGALQAVTSAEDYQIAANHIAYNNENIFESPDSLTRQEAVDQVITDSGNRLDMQTCQELLNSVGLYNRDKSDRLQWSVVYDLTDRSGRIWPRRNSSASWDFTVSEK